MILKTYVKPNLVVKLDLLKTLRDVCFSWNTPYIQHGVRRANRPLYNKLAQLQQQGLIARQGYRYCPTKYGWMALFKYENVLPS